MNDLEQLQNKCFLKAQMMIERGIITPSEKMDIFQITDLLIKLEEEKILKDKKSDQNIYYNDEIISIEEIGVMDTVDISVSGDNLFYCNGILTKNSFGLPATADFMFALISSEELESLNQIMVKQLKNRYSDPSVNRRFIVGIDRSKMRLYDVDDSAQEGLVDDRPVMDKGKFMEEENERNKPRPKFSKKQFADFK